MGQSQSSGPPLGRSQPTLPHPPSHPPHPPHPPPPPPLPLPIALRRSLKRVYSENGAGQRRRVPSRSLPASPAVAKRLERLQSPASFQDDQSPPAPARPSPTARMPLTLESVLKNFEEFAQNQWPTWAKRRGFGGATVAAEFAEPTPKPPPPTPPPPPPPSPTPPTSSSSGRVVQLDKDKWVFQRHRPIAEATTVEPDAEADADRSAPARTADDDDDVAVVVVEEKTVEILQIDDVRPGQRSRRSSGYASAAGSPVAKRAAETRGAGAATPVVETPAAPAAPAAAETTPDCGLYEMTLRWMFDLDDGPEWTDVAPLQADAVDAVTKLDAAPPTSPLASMDVDDGVVRVFFHLFSPSTCLPSHVDFRRVDPGDPVVLKLDDDQGAPRRPPPSFYARVVAADATDAADAAADPPIHLARETTSSQLVRHLVALHPQLEFETDKVALYEKTWRTGKTSRARLRRLNDTECPFILADQWAAGSGESGCAKSLVFQEAQNGDIAWEEFSLAELTSFLRVLEREEAAHERHIREKYRQMRDTMQRLRPIAESR